jgi:rhodanese-related sulfurtransferase
MSANLFPQAQPAPELTAPNRGLCGSGAPGSYRELTPHEFHARRELGVVLLKVPADQDFATFRQVFPLGSSAEIESVLADWPCERPLGLVCETGECSSRLAIRLSKRGYTVFHLAGGLREWQRCRLP